MTEEKSYSFSNYSNQINTTIDTLVFKITIRLDQKDLNLFDSLKKLEPNEQTNINLVIYTKIADLIVDESQAVRYTADYSAIPAYLKPISEEVLLKKDDKTFHFVLTGATLEFVEKNKNIFDQILSTFQFLN